jgi:SecD/SecF fusion protein
MKYIYLLSIVLLFSCGNVTPKHKYSIIYEFENLINVSDIDKLETVEVLNKRLDEFASNYQVTLNNKQQIEIKLSTDYELEAVNAIVVNPGKLDFWHVIKLQELGSFFIEANNFYKTENDSNNPLIDLIRPDSYNFGSFSVAVQDTAKIKTLLDNKEVKHLLPITLKQSKFLFGLSEGDGFLPLYLVKTTPEGIAFVNETHITNARQTYSTTGRPSISMEMNDEGTQRWERMTELAYQRGSQIAITLNDIIYSAPTVSSGAIKGGRTEIAGNFTIQEAQDLALIFSSQNRIPKLKFVNSSAINDEQ